MVVDPWFYAFAVPAILLIGISKGGFGAGLGILTVPALALVIPPLQAAGILLPILCLMDLFGLWAYRRQWDPANMRIMVPAVLLGIAIGTATAGLLDERDIRLIVGSIAVLFALDYWLRRGESRAAAGRSVLKGGFWSVVAGFTSFVSHAGGPPISVYLLPQKLDKTTYVGTTVVLFAIVNYVKLVPYAWLGQLAPGNLLTSLVLAPLAPLGMGLGIWLHNRVSPRFFYQACYVLIFVVGAKLAWDGVTS
ncbi:MAG: sulfite exporter TauE/SafE family protein [Alphaproteobacteria bacterium]|nr:sulfite exporter TauE/SafE family protein [Alphaproteobacteria bacterium]HJP20825.1 sulfite exporter TauE/SafE family protein [Alphaproteobacteria bacterium]